MNELYVVNYSREHHDTTTPRHHVDINIIVRVCMMSNERAHRSRTETWHGGRNLGVNWWVSSACGFIVEYMGSEGVGYHLIPSKGFFFRFDASSHNLATQK
jgi:hypothetical protein